MISDRYSYLPFGAAQYSGAAEGYVKFTMEHQLMNADTWAAFVQVFRADSDVETGAWRCEYWDKMMRGAASVSAAIRRLRSAVFTAAVRALRRRASRSCRCALLCRAGMALC